jgi:hypothetical protein
MGRAARLVVARTSDGACRVDVYSRTPGGWGRCCCCRAPAAAAAAPIVSVTAARGVGVQITGPRGVAHAFIPACAVRGVFVHEAFLHCRVVATLAIDTGGDRLVLPLEPAGFDFPLTQLGDAWRAIAGALDLVA